MPAATLWTVHRILVQFEASHRTSVPDAKTSQRRVSGTAVTARELTPNPLVREKLGAGRSSRWWAATLTQKYGKTAGRGELRDRSSTPTGPPRPRPPGLRYGYTGLEAVISGVDGQGQTDPLRKRRRSYLDVQLARKGPDSGPTTGRVKHNGPGWASKAKRSGGNASKVDTVTCNGGAANEIWTAHQSTARFGEGQMPESTVRMTRPPEAKWHPAPRVGWQQTPPTAKVRSTPS